MNKKQVIKILEDTLYEIKKEATVQKKGELGNIIKKYEKTLIYIESDSLKYNEIHNSVKAYLEVYNDYENPLLYKMSDAEMSVEQYLNN